MLRKVVGLLEEINCFSKRCQIMKPPQYQLC